MLKKFVFLDRDGVINYDSPDYIKCWKEFKFLPGSLEAIKKLTVNGFSIILITNQSVIRRHMVTRAGLEHIHSMMNRAVESTGGKITDIFYCPHLPEDRCKCRKPEPGLILRAQNRYHIDLASAVMAGDSAKDIECAVNAGCGRAVLIKTGNGMHAEAILQKKHILPDYVAENLLDAADWIIRSSRYGS